MKRKTHGLSSHILYPKWVNMMHRCYCQNNKRYSDWGGRGIDVCMEWHNVDNFINDMFPSYIKGLSLDRKDNNKGYSKDNCRWVEDVVQKRNTRVLNKVNTSGYRCVSKTSSNKYRTQIKVNSKKIHIGTFNTAIEAAKAYDKYVIDNSLEHTLNDVL